MKQATKWKGRNLIYKRGLNDVLREARDLVEKCKFLVHRSEFLHQQGLMFNNQAQELLRDAAVSGEHASKLDDRLDKIEEALYAARRKPSVRRKHR
jgi:hypothetical protein